MVCQGLGDPSSPYRMPTNTTKKKTNRNRPHLLEAFVVSTRNDVSHDVPPSAFSPSFFFCVSFACSGLVLSFFSSFYCFSFLTCYFGYVFHALHHWLVCFVFCCFSRTRTLTHIFPITKDWNWFWFVLGSEVFF